MALSGGVDSSVAALLLKQQGYEIVGAHMKLWDYAEVGGDIHRDGRCCSLDSIDDCRRVCDAIDSPFYTFNLSRQFEAEVIEDFVAEYLQGRTPNPCIRCNTLLKWDAFLTKADELDCQFIATGHYAVVEKQDDRYLLKKGRDDTRDQSYVLWGLTQEALSRTLMPLGNLLKTEVRAIAREHGLSTAENKESREICFVADDNYGRFLREWQDRKGRESFEPGDIVHEDGTILGKHQGTPLYTIGQRRGLGIGSAGPYYVLAIEAATNRVIVGPNDSLMRREVTVERINWIAAEPSAQEFNATVKIRSQHPGAKAIIRPLTDGSVHVIFDETQRAITPGQSAVLYDNDVVLGGGIIA
jgi:tRNA-specific 2-thiouridylase